MKEKVVIKVGGSLLSRSDNDLFDFRYAYHLSDMIKSLCEDGYAVALNVGGGYLNRKYIALLKENGEHDITDQHLVGIAVTNLNAQIMRGLLGTLVPFDLIAGKDFDLVANREKMIMVEEGRAVVFGGGKPGGSNDLNACLIANAIGTKKVFDLKNVSGVFTSDPKKDERAELIPDISWNDYLQVIGNPTEHAPGAHYPVDPLAARLAAKNGIDFCILHGDNITNVLSAIRGETYTGTLIHS